MYAPQIAWWLGFYPPDRFLFLNQDELKKVGDGTRGLGWMAVFGGGYWMHGRVSFL